MVLKIGNINHLDLKIVASHTKQNRFSKTLQLLYLHCIKIFWFN